MSAKPKILCVYDQGEGKVQLPSELTESFDVVVVRNPLRAIAQLAREQFAGVYVTTDHFGEALRLGRLLQNERILEGMPDGVVLIDSENTIQWANDRFCKWAGQDEVIGENFYQSLHSPEILGPDYSPFHNALSNRKPSTSTLRSGENHYFQLHAAPVQEMESSTAPQHLIVTIRDVTAEMLQQQKLAAIHKAGVELSNLTAEEVFQMDVEDRIDLLKQNILHYTQDLLNFDVVEIRLLDQASGALTPLLAVGLDQEATDRQLFARPQNNGVTGFVASTGKSYLCEDTTEDPLYLEGFKGAKSSLTVPLILHDQVIGTFNVESPEPRAFTESDLQFLEIFSRDVALALNTLELLVAQQANACFESVEAIHGAVALPVDEILNDAVNVMERYIGHEPQVVERLQRILRNARDMKQAITKVGEKLTTAKAVPAGVQMDEHPHLRGVRVLVVDEDESVRGAAHALLERLGCIVETAHDGVEAVSMVRSSDHYAPYNVIICDIRLPDMSGYGVLCKLQEIMTSVPMLLMTGYGYDPGHSIVKCRQAGLHAQAVLYKPFRRDQLLEKIDAMLDPAKAIPGKSSQAAPTPATT